MSDLSKKVLSVLQTNQKNGILRKELILSVTGIWSPDHDRIVRLALAKLRKEHNHTISHNGLYFLLSRNSPQEIKAAAREYVARQKAAAKTALHEWSLLEKELQDFENYELEDAKEQE